jgi:hypothetical protein
MVRFFGWSIDGYRTGAKKIQFPVTVFSMLDKLHEARKKKFNCFKNPSFGLVMSE